MSRKKDVAEKRGTALEGVNFEDDAGAGFENADGESFALPILTILQKLSPMCDTDKPEYNPDAKPGMLLNTITLELFPASKEDGDLGLRVIPVHFKRSFIEWIPRNKGGGFVAEYGVVEGKEQLATTERDDMNRDMLPNGNELYDTRVHYVLLIVPGTAPRPAMIAMTRTQIKRSKRWLSVMDNIKMRRSDGTMFTPATFSHSYVLHTVTETKGENTWKGWDISPEEALEDGALYAAAKEFRKMLMAGKVEENFDQDAAKVDETGM